MAHHYIERKANEPWNSKKTMGLFWIRRFFRIAPLFYTMLILAFILGPLLGDCRSTIAAIWPNTATPLERYNDNSLLNFVTHASFIFGLLPHFAFRSPLPDWSIGLEMQFYLVFPLIMLALSIIGPIRSSIIIVIGCLGLHVLFPAFFHNFQMPSFLPIKLYVFLVGIWIAVSRSQDSMKVGFLISLAIAVLWMFIERDPISIARVLLVTAMFYLMDNGTMPFSLYLRRAVIRTRELLSNRISRFLGDTSYSTYLLHLLIVLPMAAWLSSFAQYKESPGFVRFVVCLIMAMPVIYIGAWLLFNLIEQNGIALGKYFLKTIGSERRTKNIYGS